MKKLYLGLILASVSTIALAQNVTPVSGITEMVKNNIMSADVNYESEPTVKQVTNGFEVSVPQGSMKIGNNQKIEAFTFPVTEDGAKGKDKRYVIKLDKMSQIFPTFEKMLGEKKASYSKVDYIAKFIPTLQFVESQELSIEDLKMPFEGNFSASVTSMKFSDTSEMLSEKTVKQADKVSMQGFSLIHPMVALMADTFDFDVSVPETSKAKSPIEQVLQTPRIQQNMTLNGGKIRSIAFGQQGALTFNLNQSLDVKQDLKTQNVVVDFKLSLNDITQNVAPIKTPAQIVANISATGFTITQLMNVSDATDKVNDAQALPESSRKEVILKGVQKEAEDAMAALKKDMKIDINEIAANADEYAVVLTGKATPKDETFKGTLQVTNFEYLAPEPKKVDEAACQELVNQMLENKIEGADFRTRYEATCNENRGVLDALRPYAGSAKKVKDKQGKDALQFAVEINGGSLFINGKKVEDENLNPSALLGH